MPTQPSKRRKLNKEEPPEWKEIKPLTYKDFQITANQQGMLDSDTTWFTPQNIHQYQQDPTIEEPVLPTEITAAAAIRNGQHPDLSSPEPLSQIARPQDEPMQFQTQAVLAPTIMDREQFEVM